MDNHKYYQGIARDPYRSMNPTGNIINDAWVFGIIPKTGTCRGWAGTRDPKIPAEPHRLR